MSLFTTLFEDVTMRALAAGVLAGVLLFAPVSVDAWGLDVHRWITRRALAALPEPLKTFYASRAEMVVEHSVDPDLWRVVNLADRSRRRGPESLSGYRRA